ncbi:MAG: VCBS repeat-containing protein [Acidobacteria bacterium]|nr:VCBS repeat-containing protein [Acidobacteriota bacterium]
MKRLAYALIGHGGSNNLTVLLGDGRGGFKPAIGSPFDAGAPAERLAVGDTNADGKLDIAFTYHDSLNVFVMLGQGDGRFVAAPGSPFAALKSGRPHNHGVVFADTNADGKLDITTANNNDNSVSVLLGDGRGGFVAATGSPFPVGRAPYPQALGDTNADGKLDIVTPNVNGGNISVLLGDGNAHFTPAPNSPLTVASRPFYVAISDFNGDGKPDLASSHDDISLITILLGDGRGNFSPAPNSPLDLGRLAYEIIPADMDGDGKIDLVVSVASGNHVAVLLGDGRGGFQHAAGSPFVAGSGAYSVAAGDLNGDGKMDVVTANSRSNDITVLLNN